MLIIAKGGKAVHVTGDWMLNVKFREACVYDLYLTTACGWTPIVYSGTENACRLASRKVTMAYINKNDFVDISEVEE
jgi:hypothetical protein